MDLKTQVTFSLIICTYERAKSLKRLLDSVNNQSLYPNEIIIVDGSNGSETEELLGENNYRNTIYHKVEKENRGLTKQRNYGINQSGDVDIICFLDDDIVVEADYFLHLIQTYEKKPDALAVGGWIKDETNWRDVGEAYKPEFKEFHFDGYVRELGQRNVLRKRLGLLSNKPPGFMPEYSHGFSTGFLPPSGNTYQVEFFMGGVSSYRKSLFRKIGFSTYFEGYGLYEDMDFCLRASNFGRLYVNTSARVRHLHEESGRPDYYKYGKMVVRNGNYVWKLKYPNPRLVNRFKWNSIILLLAAIRFKNEYLNGERGAARDAMGRLRSWCNLILKNK